MHGSTGWRPRRLVKAGIAASAAGAAFGAFFASQAGAAQVTTKNVMIRLPAHTRCAYVYVLDPGTGKTYGFRKVDYKATHWYPRAWNSPGLTAPVDSTVRVYSASKCTQE